MTAPVDQAVEAAAARREIGKWLNEEQTKPVDRVALAQLCAGFDRLARPLASEVVEAEVDAAYNVLAAVIHIGHPAATVRKVIRASLESFAASRAPVAVGVGPILVGDDLMVLAVNAGATTAPEFWRGTVLGYRVEFPSLEALVRYTLAAIKDSTPPGGAGGSVGAQPVQPAAPCEHLRGDAGSRWCALAEKPAAPSPAARLFPSRILALLKEVARRENTECFGPWEDELGEPLQDDADTALAWIAALTTQSKEQP